MVLETLNNSLGEPKIKPSRSSHKWLNRNPKLVSLGIFVVLVALWEVISFGFPHYLLPSPWETWQAFINVSAHGNLWPACWITLQQMAVGFFIALVLGIIVGFIIGLSPTIDRFVSPYLNALYVTPHVMLIPLFIIWFGIGWQAIIVYVFLNTYFPIVINTTLGIREARSEVTEMANSFCATRWQMVRKVYLPGAMPMILAGVRLGVGRAIVAVITAQMLLALSGVGYLVVDFGNLFRTDEVIATALVVALFGILMTSATGWLGRRVTPWNNHEKS